MFISRLLRIVVLIVAMSLVACAPGTPAELTIRLEPQFDGAAVNCTTEFGEDGSTRLTDFRFYVSEVRLRDKHGNWIDTTMSGSSSAVALIDFEDATGNCLNGTTDTNDELRIHLPDDSDNDDRESGQEGDYFNALRFTLGVPFDLNHDDPLQAVTPLTEPSMHWHWRSGYKFLRLGLAFGDERWHVHLGSTGCKGPITAVSGCERPNRASVLIEDWSPGRTVTIAIDALVEGINVSSVGSAHCLGDHENPACRTVLRNLGLNPDTGHVESTGLVFGGGGL